MILPAHAQTMIVGTAAAVQLWGQPYLGHAAVLVGDCYRYRAHRPKCYI